MDALAAYLRFEAPGPNRLLGRLARAVLARWLLPAAVAVAEAVGAVLTEDSPSGTRVPIDLTVSAACLAGACSATADREGCQSSACEHDCLGDQGRPGRDGTPAA